MKGILALSVYFTTILLSEDTMSAIKQRLQDEIKSSMRSKDKPRLDALRFIYAAIKQKEIDERTELNDEQVLSMMDKMCKQRRDAMDQFKKAGRAELAEKEQFELDLLQEFLPKPLSNEELENLVNNAIASISASGMQDMGKVMAKLKPDVAGRCDMSQVSQMIKSKLGA